MQRNKAKASKASNNRKVACTGGTNVQIPVSFLSAVLGPARYRILKKNLMMLKKKSAENSISKGVDLTNFRPGNMLPDPP